MAIATASEHSFIENFSSRRARLIRAPKDIMPGDCSADAGMGGLG
jgi:hypothetical protein